MTNGGVTYVTDNVNSVTGSVFEQVARNATDNVTGESIAELYRAEMLHYMKSHPKIATEKIANILLVYRMTISRDINILRSQIRLERNGDDRNGSWVVID